MDRIHQFLELLEGRGVGVEFRQRRFHREIVQRGKRTAVAAHLAVGGRNRVDRKKLNDPAAQGADDEVKLADHVAERAGRRDDGIALTVELFGQFFIFDGMVRGHGGAELPGENCIDGVGAIVFGGFDFDGDIAGTACPDRTGDFRVAKPAFGFEHTDFEQRQPDFKNISGDFAHGDIVPGAAERRYPVFGMAYLFGTAGVRPSEVGPQKGFSGRYIFDMQLKNHAIAAVKQQIGSRQRCLFDHSAILFFVKLLTRKRLPRRNVDSPFHKI